MVTAEDPFSHTYGGSSEFNIAAFSTTFDRRSFGRRIVARINTNINEPTISADRSWAYLNFGSTHKHRFLYDTGASHHRHSNTHAKMAKWERSGRDMESASKTQVEGKCRSQVYMLAVIS
jgi:hypothetical protein